MADAEIAARTPAVVNLEPGKKYFWCRCGRSSNQPFCDGSHQGSGFTPVRFEVDAERRVALCRCKRTGNQPYCDGTHATLAPA